MTKGKISPVNPRFSLFICKTVLLATAILCANRSVAQSLPEVTIRTAHPSGYTVWQADSLPVSAVLSLSERLLWENPLALRANAPGTLTTISARGAGPNRTPVLWNGLNLQSPQNGVADVSLVPLWPGDDLRLTPGGQSTAAGSGAMGGVLKLTSNADVRPGFSANLGIGAGSFARREAQGKVAWRKNGFHTAIQGYFQEAENDFRYVNTTQIGQPEQKQANNGQRRMDIQQFNGWVYKPGHEINTAVWYQHVRREIPPSMTSVAEDTWQEDQSLRAVLSWKQGTHWQHRAAWSDERLRFFLKGDTDTSQARTALWWSRYQTSADKPFQLQIEAQVMPQWGQADGYADSSKWYAQTRASMASNGIYHWKTGQIAMGLRQEWTNFADVPLLWSIGATQQLGAHVELHAHASRNYNLPTFNDRFWKAFGNADLKAEDGYSAELGLQWSRMVRTTDVKAELTGFHLLLDDWILWQPGPDGIFRPGNLRQVWSRGLETALSCQQRFERLRVAARVHYQYASTTHTAVYSGSEIVLNKQLIYTPNHLAGLTLRVETCGWAFAYLHQLSGARYTASDESAQLDPYHTGQVLAQYRFQVHAFRISLDGRIENCWNAPYQVIAYRPMPGRSYRIGLSIGF
jgi:iron complex outermembrane receptor protein